MRVRATARCCFFAIKSKPCAVLSQTMTVQLHLLAGELGYAEAFFVPFVTGVFAFAAAALVPLPPSGALLLLTAPTVVTSDWKKKSAADAACLLQSTPRVTCMPSG